MPQPVCWWEIAGKDGPALQNFYAELFDWKVNTDNPMSYGMVNTGGNGSIDGGIYASDEPKQPLIYVAVPDLQASLDKVEQLGGKMVMPPTEIPNSVTFALFSDPAGSVFGLIKQD